MVFVGRSDVCRFPNAFAEDVFVLPRGTRNRSIGFFRPTICLRDGMPVVTKTPRLLDISGHEESRRFFVESGCETAAIARPLAALGVRRVGYPL